MEKELVTFNLKQLNSLITNNILVTTPSIKKNILTKSFIEKTIISFKVFTEQELYNYLNIQLPEEVEYLLFKKIKNYHLSSTIIKNIEKFIFLYKNIKSEIIKENGEYTLDKDHYLYNIIKEKQMQIIINNLVYLDELGYLKQTYENIEENIYSLNVHLDYLDLNITYISMLEENVNKPTIPILEFTNIEEEIFYTLNKVAKLLLNGVKPNKIMIYGNNKYKKTLKILSAYFNIPFKTFNFYTISEEKVNKIIESIKEGDLENISDIEEVINFINKNLKFIKEKDFEYYAQKKLSSLKIKEEEIKNGVNFSSIEDFVYEGECYNFILGFNNYDFLKYRKNDSFINDSIKEILHQESAESKNKKMLEQVEKTLKYIAINPKFNKISYSTKVSKNSVLINDKFQNKINFVTIKTSESNYTYSKASAIYNFKKYKHKSIKENIKYEQVNTLGNNLDFIDKKNIDFSPKGSIIWDKENFIANRNISATLLDKYYKCNFAFYIEEILKIKKRASNTLELDVGIYIHNVLEKVINENSQKKYIEKNKINKSKLKNDILINSKEILEQNPELFKVNKSQKKFLEYKITSYIIEISHLFLKQTTEENFKILAAEKDITILRGLYKLNGKVDIILNYKDRVMVIDYKTGSTELDLKDTLLDAGLNLQNLIYFILIKNKYPESLFGGTYRYKVKPKITKFTKDNISLREGYTSSEEIVLKNIYKPNYKKLNIKQDGTLGSRSHTFSDEQFEEKLQKVEEKIFEFIKSIEEQKKYPAKPLKNSKVDSCKYCSYQELCYKAKQDYQYLK